MFVEMINYGKQSCHRCHLDQNAMEEMVEPSIDMANKHRSFIASKEPR